MGIGTTNAPTKSSGGSGVILDSIYIATPPTKTSYYVGESFDTSGMVVKANYSNGSAVIIKDVEITAYSVSPATLAESDKKVIVSYTEAGETKTTDVVVTVTKRSFADPSQSNSLVYTGDSKSPTWNGFNATYMTKTGSESETNAGSYPVVFKLKDKTASQWSDGTTDDKTIYWSIGQATPVVTAPTPITGMSYTGSARNLINAGNTSGGTLQYKLDTGSWGTSIPQATDADTYTIYYRVVGNTNYKDVAQKSVQTTIAQASGSLTLSKTTIELDTTKTSDTFTITRAGTGTITVKSSDESVATAVLNGTTVTVTGIKSGSVTITVKVAASKNYTAPADKTCSTTVSFIPSDISEATPAVIAEVGATGNADDYWDVGDLVPVKLNGTIGTKTFSNLTLYMPIVHFNYKGQNGVYLQGFKSAKTNGVDVALRDWTADQTYGDYKTDGTKLFNMNHWGNYNYGGWKACDLRYDILGSTEKAPSGYGSAKATSAVGYDATSAAKTSPVANTFMAALPADFRAALAPITLYVDNTGNKSNVDANVTACVDYCPLPTEFNIHGARTYANQYEKDHQEQFAFYAAGNSKVKYAHDKTSQTVSWWCSSPYYNDTYSFCYVNDGGNADYGHAGYSCGLAPVVRLAA